MRVSMSSIRPQPAARVPARADRRRGDAASAHVGGPPPSSARRQLSGTGSRRHGRPRQRDAAPAPAPAPLTQVGGEPARKSAARATIRTRPGRMNAAPATSAPSGPRTRQPQKIASWVEAGPGRRLQAAIASSNSRGSSQRRRSTHSSRSSAMWAGGPPKPRHPSRPQARATVVRATSSRPPPVML